MYTPTKELMDALVSELELARKIGRGEGGFNADRKFDHERRNLQQVIENQKAIIEAKKSHVPASFREAWVAVVEALEKASPDFLFKPGTGIECAVRAIKQLADEAFNVDDQKAELRREHRRQLRAIRDDLRKEGIHLIMSDYDFKYEGLASAPPFPFPKAGTTTSTPADPPPPGKPYASVNLGPDWHGIPIDEPAAEKRVEFVSVEKTRFETMENQIKALVEGRERNNEEYRAIVRALRAIGVTLKYRDDGSFAGVDYDKLGSGA